MKYQLLKPLAAFLLAVIPVAAQQQPKPKSQKEVEALQKVQAAQNDPDAELQAIDYVLEHFADTEYKIMLLNMATDAAQRKGDYEKTVLYGERTLEADPGNIPVRITLAQAIVSHTRENDLDKDQSLKKVEDYANKALDLLKTAATPPPGIPDAQWPDTKKDFASQAHEVLGQDAELRKKYDDAIAAYKTAIAEAAKPSLVASARLAKAYVGAKQYDDAIATADKVLAANDAQPAVKQFAQQQKDIATKLKSAK
jgi:tetratricopeptide (TPR) repeat protein